MAKVNLFKFLQEVRTETDKVTWPTRRETAITTAMVFVMVFVASIFRASNRQHGDDLRVRFRGS